MEVEFEDNNPQHAGYNQPVSHPSTMPNRFSPINEDIRRRARAETNIITEFEASNAQFKSDRTETTGY